MNWLKNIFKKKEDRSMLIAGPIINGHQLYKFPSFESMHWFRERQIRTTYEFSQFGMIHSDLIAGLRLILKANNENNNSDVGTLANTMLLQTENYASEKIIMELAGYGVIVDDEPLKTVTVKHNQIKSELLKDSEAYAFFLNTAHSYLVMLGETLSSSQLEESMKDPKRRMREEMYLKWIGSTKVKGLWSASIARLSGFQVQEV